MTNKSNPNAVQELTKELLKTTFMQEVMHEANISEPLMQAIISDKIELIAYRNNIIIEYK